MNLDLVILGTLFTVLFIVMIAFILWALNIFRYAIFGDMIKRRKMIIESKKRMRLDKFNDDFNDE